MIFFYFFLNTLSKSVNKMSSYDSYYRECRRNNEDCFCSLCCRYENEDEDSISYCECDRCIGLVNDTNAYDEELEYERESINIFKEICDFFQIPSLYKKMEITNFYNTDCISDFKFVEQNEITNDEICNIIKNYIDSICYESDNLIKKIKIMIFFQLVNISKIRNFITARNEIFDSLEIKFKEFTQSNDDVFVKFIEQFNFCV